MISLYDLIPQIRFEIPRVLKCSITALGCFTVWITLLFGVCSFPDQSMWLVKSGHSAKNVCVFFLDVLCLFFLLQSVSYQCR